MTAAVAENSLEPFALPCLPKPATAQRHCHEAREQGHSLTRKQCHTGIHNPARTGSRLDEDGRAHLELEPNVI